MPDEGAPWVPSDGATLSRYISSRAYLDELGREELRASTLRILSRCMPPDEFGARTLLVVGEVQSGKTASFTALIAAARDNGFAVAVVMAGTKKILHEQTATRLSEDLQVAGDGGAQSWVALISPKQNQWPIADACVARWADPHVPTQHKPVLLVTCLKTAAGINGVTRLVRGLQERLGTSIPTIVIDDEGDQAGLNLQHGTGDMSATYGAIDELRRTLQSHSYVLYTATPQALVLISLADSLTPKSVVVLQSGPDYVGGRELFVEDTSRFFQPIPDGEISSATSPSTGDAPPLSLRRALAAFIVALAVAQRREEGPRPISMLIHPSAKKDVHRAYDRWVRSILANWRQASEDPEQWDEVLESTLLPAATALHGQLDLRSVFGLDSSASDAQVAAALANEIPFWLREIDGDRIRVVNSDRGLRDLRSADWVSAPGWVLIGGNKLERGFTIENLAVTYMPRGRGVGLVDTIQQRGRFFGYKRSYKPLLRGWLNSDVRDAFRQIVEHEQLLRADLLRVDRDEISLAEWRRNLIMNPDLQPTRAAVVSMGVSRHEVREGWRFKQHRLFDPALAELRPTVAPQLERLRALSHPHPHDTRTDREHLVAAVSAMELAEMLFDWPLHSEDRAALDPLLVLLRHYARVEEHLDTHVVLMDGLQPRRRRADEGSVGELPKNWRIQNLHAGRSSNYAGDARFRTPDAVTLQIHNVVPFLSGTGAEFAAVLAVALAWPAGFDRALVQQL